MRFGFQQRLTTLFPASFGLETNSALAPLLAHRAMPFQVFVLFDFVVQLNVDWMPVEVFMQATARLLQVLTVAEGTSVCI